MALIGNERIIVQGVAPTGGLASVGESVTTQEIANLAAAGAITSAAMKTWVLTLPTTETADDWWLNGNVLCYGIVTP